MDTFSYLLELLEAEAVCEFCWQVHVLYHKDLQKYCVIKRQLLQHMHLQRYHKRIRYIALVGFYLAKSPDLYTLSNSIRFYDL